MSEVSKKWSHLASINGDARALIILSSDEPGYCEVVGKIIKKDHAALIVAAVNSYPSRQRLVSALQAIVEHGDKTLISVEWGHGYSAGANAAFASMAAEARSALAEIGEQK